MNDTGNIGLFEKRESKILDLDINSNTKLESYVKSILNSIEYSQDKCRLSMSKATLQSEKDYWCGVIGGLTCARQHLQKELGV